MRELRSWVRQLRRKEIDPVAWETNAERTEWDHFLARFDHRHITAWRDIEAILPVEWTVEEPPRKNTRVRVDRILGTARALVSSVSAFRSENDDPAGNP